MTDQPKRLISPTTLLIVVVVFMIYKYWYDHRPPPQPTTDAVFSQLNRAMEQRINAVPESVKRRINLSEAQFTYTPHQASYQVLMHVQELFSGNAIAKVTQDCDHWYEEFAVQLKPSRSNSVMLFDYEAKRMESLTSRRAEINNRTQTWVNGKEEVNVENLSFQKIGQNLELRSEGESHILAPETKLNIEGAHFILNQIEKENWYVEFLSEPDDFSEYPIQNKVTIEPYNNDPLLNNLWVLKTEEFKDEGSGYKLASSVIELINDRAVTLYAASLDTDNILYELILGDFEYIPSRCRQVASL